MRITGGDLVKGFGAVYWFRPRFRGVQGGQNGLKGGIIGVLIESDSETGDLGVEGFDADAKIGSANFADAVVVGLRQFRQ